MIVEVLKEVWRNKKMVCYYVVSKALSLIILGIVGGFAFLNAPIRNFLSRAANEYPILAILILIMLIVLWAYLEFKKKG